MAFVPVVTPGVPEPSQLNAPVLRPEHLFARHYERRHHSVPGPICAPPEPSELNKPVQRPDYLFARHYERRHQSVPEPISAAPPSLEPDPTHPISESLPA
ncbi:hypothetical protein FRX31_002618, partial [Thalictrum thalictroides]